MQDIVIRHAQPSDAEKLAALEKQCYPESEAGSTAEMADRIEMYGSHFVLVTEGSKILSYADGMASDVQDLFDVFYEDPFFHAEDGHWQMIFGVGTDPACRHHGYAAKAIQEMIREAKEEKRYGVVLLCSEETVPYFQKFGFEEEGTHTLAAAGKPLHEMRLCFERGR